MTKLSVAPVKEQKSKKERFIANGMFFPSHEAVEEYARLNDYRISNTQTIRRGTFLVTLQIKGGLK
jgi:hypothetical protein